MSPNPAAAAAAADLLLRDALEAGLAALGLDAVGAETVDRLLAYQALIARWNRVYNLTAVRDPGEMLKQHLLDSLAVISPLRRYAAQRGATDRPAAGAADGLRLLDVGSGAGLPGVVIAILQPAWPVCCVDAVAKKASFIRQAAGELGLPRLTAVHARVETLEAAPFDLVTSRAFASLADFVTLTRRHLAPGGVWMAMKGRRPDDELAALPAGVTLRQIEPLQVPGLAAQRCLVWLAVKGPPS